MPLISVAKGTPCTQGVTDAERMEGRARHHGAAHEFVGGNMGVGVNGAAHRCGRVTVEGIGIACDIQVGFRKFTAVVGRHQAEPGFTVAVTGVQQIDKINTLAVPVVSQSTVQRQAGKPEQGVAALGFVFDAPVGVLSHHVACGDLGREAGIQKAPALVIQQILPEPGRFEIELGRLSGIRCPKIKAPATVYGAIGLVTAHEIAGFRRLHRVAALSKGMGGVCGCRKCGARWHEQSRGPDQGRNEMFHVCLPVSCCC
ncbi:hypothetical protein [Marinobacter sp. VGCF2001]|uniref:hypothetical protein n=1 Tax=Marinobacter sp. VGCF2001 TaxID=3417189 RepID=UPI003CEAD513